MRWLYTVIFYLALPLILARLLWRARKAPAYARRWAERFGVFPRPQLKDSVIWLHSVSVGESIAAAPLVKALMARHPDTSFVVTTTTPTGSEQVRKIYGDSVFHVYAPYDLPGCVRRFLTRIRPGCLIIMETEVWPNTLALCRARGIPAILANGRLSEKSAAGYRRFAWLIGPAFAGLSAAAAQHEDDAARMQSLGLASGRTHVTGNIKFDLSIPQAMREQAERLRADIQRGGSRPVWIAASTHRGEDEEVLASFAALRQRHPQLFLVLVPRHPERFGEVAQLCESRGFRVLRRSSRNEPEADTDILLGDTMGELLLLFGVADLAFVGGSLVPVGGHNLIEPAAWGLPVLSGPHLFNFAEASRLLQDAGAMAVADDQSALAAAVQELLDSESKRKEMGRRALAVAEANRGALEELIQVVEMTYWAKSAGET